MSPGPIQLDQATALTLMLGPNGSVGIQASSDRVYKGVLPIIHHAELGTTWDRENAYAAGLIQLLSHGRVDQKLATALPASTCTRISEKAHT